MSKAGSTKSAKKSTATTTSKRRQPPRKFETLEVSNESPAIITRKSSETEKDKLYFVV